MQCSRKSPAWPRTAWPACGTHLVPFAEGEGPGRFASPRSILVYSAEKRSVWKQVISTCCLPRVAQEQLRRSARVWSDCRHPANVHLHASSLHHGSSTNTEIEVAETRRAALLTNSKVNTCLTTTSVGPGVVDEDALPKSATTTWATR